MATPSPAHHRAQQRLARQLAEIDFALPGTISVREMRCGKKRCRCKADPPQLHGPYIQWTRTVHGKTVTKLLAPEQLARYQPWIDNARKLRQLTGDLEALTIQAVHHAEGWDQKS
jgi:hypothetical protein